MNTNRNRSLVAMNKRYVFQTCVVGWFIHGAIRGWNASPYDYTLTIPIADTRFVPSSRSTTDRMFRSFFNGVMYISGLYTPFSVYQTICRWEVSVYSSKYPLTNRQLYKYLYQEFPLSHGSHIYYNFNPI